ncbi:MAG: hypothetical protein CMD33_07660, partial [Flavobacteriales bacterium]|nr:hypothetical protein [Flavobacteriales bacterium]
STQGEINSDGFAAGEVPRHKIPPLKPQLLRLRVSVDSTSCEHSDGVPKPKAGNAERHRPQEAH